LLSTPSGGKKGTPGKAPPWKVFPRSLQLKPSSFRALRATSATWIWQQVDDVTFRAEHRGELGGSSNQLLAGYRALEDDGIARWVCLDRVAGGNLLEPFAEKGQIVLYHQVEEQSLSWIEEHQGGDPYGLST
jgi:hypothetical protein